MHIVSDMLSVLAYTQYVGKNTTSAKIGTMRAYTSCHDALYVRVANTEPYGYELRLYLLCDILWCHCRL